MLQWQPPLSDLQFFVIFLWIFLPSFVVCIILHLKAPKCSLLIIIIFLHYYLDRRTYLLLYGRPTHSGTIALFCWVFLLASGGGKRKAKSRSEGAKIKTESRHLSSSYEYDSKRQAGRYTSHKNGLEPVQRRSVIVDATMHKKSAGRSVDAVWPMSRWTLSVSSFLCLGKLLEFAFTLISSIQRLSFKRNSLPAKSDSPLSHFFSSLVDRYFQNERIGGKGTRVHK